MATNGGHAVKPGVVPPSYSRIPPIYAYPPPPSPADLAAAYATALKYNSYKYGYASPAVLPPAPVSYAPLPYATPLPPSYWPAYTSVAPPPPPPPPAHAHHFIDQHFDYAHRQATIIITKRSVSSSIGKEF
ncbi:hypothetical protein TNCT_692461 [Trichonephila clavata]|uniref:Uncharacterized protein n=1 Tax=Trichonephila clavata TaxID=2740835 RepID=A0A8X6M027_TRICU|nr:hypothetical protein TNCT_692461 [Trichonephila clavata]